jgi:hypothetical protein
VARPLLVQNLDRRRVILIGRGWLVVHEPHLFHQIPEAHHVLRALEAPSQLSLRRRGKLASWARALCSWYSHSSTCPTCLTGKIRCFGRIRFQEPAPPGSWSETLEQVLEQVLEQAAPPSAGQNAASRASYHMNGTELNGRSLVVELQVSGFQVQSLIQIDTNTGLYLSYSLQLTPNLFATAAGRPLRDLSPHAIGAAKLQRAFLTQRDGNPSL